MKYFFNLKLAVIYLVFAASCNCCCAKRKCEDGNFQNGTLTVSPSYLLAQYPGRSCQIPTGGFGDPCSNTGNNFFATTWDPTKYAMSIQISTTCPNFANGLSSLLTAGTYLVENDECDRSSVITYAVNLNSPNCSPSVYVPVFEGGSFGVTVLFWEDCVSAQCENPQKNCGNNSNGQPQMSNRPKYRYATEVNIEKNQAGGLVTTYAITAMLQYQETTCTGNCQ